MSEETRAEAAARLLRMLEERSRKRRRIQAPPREKQLAFELISEPAGNRIRAINDPYPNRHRPTSGQ